MLVTPVFAVVNFASAVSLESGFSSVFFDVGLPATGFSVLAFSTAGLVETGFTRAAFSAVGFLADRFFAGSATAFEAGFLSGSGFSAGKGFVAGANLDSVGLGAGFAGAAFTGSDLVVSGFPAVALTLNGLLPAFFTSALSTLTAGDFSVGVLDDDAVATAGDFGATAFVARALGSTALDSGAEVFAAGVLGAGVLDAVDDVVGAVFVGAACAEPLDFSEAFGGSTGFGVAVPVALVGFLSGADFPAGAAGGVDFDALPAPTALPALIAGVVPLDGLAATIVIVGFLADFKLAFGRSNNAFASLFTAINTSQTTLSLELAWNAIPAWCSNEENSSARFFGIVRSSPGTLPDAASVSLTTPDNIMIFIDELSTGIA